ncbi:MAG: hypothetical protein AAF623_04760, partial [Planctomycetota bacterium]
SNGISSTSCPTSCRTSKTREIPSRQLASIGGDSATQGAKSIQIVTEASTKFGIKGEIASTNLFTVNVDLDDAIYRNPLS